jgi:predicted dehydrogenase
MIGEITGGNVYWNQNMLWYRSREKGWSDMEWMIRDWVNWKWLSGDHIVEQHVHNIDVFLWMSGYKVAKATGFGSRQRRITGDQYDNFSIDYEMENGVHLHSMCRQLDGCSNLIGEVIQGTKGSWNSMNHEIKDLKGNVIWKYDKAAAEAEFKQHNPYVLEHVDWVNHIRKGTMHDEATECAISSLVGVMGRESAYKGSTITWDEISQMELDYMPEKLELGAMDMSKHVVEVPGKEQK